ncbi:acyl-CoA dehydrogenase family protein [Alcaligenaceae bacterium]|nr:acyl-CoA dehydrogenase family protein [Alcaligenaceae bacterium]
MNFSLTEEQQMLEDAVRRFVEKEYQGSGSGALADTTRARWKMLAELGLLGLLVPVEHGGLGKDITDALLVMRMFGRGLVSEPYLSNAVVAASILERAASPTQQAYWLPALANGSTLFAIASEDDNDQPQPEGVLWRDGRIYGRKSAVLAGNQADWLIVPAQCADTGKERLFCIDTQSKGLLMDVYPGLDDISSTEIQFDGVQAEASRELTAFINGVSSLEWGLDMGRTALCAEAWGLMEALMEQTLEHLNTRKQFGKPLSSFQVLQHRIVDIMASVEQTHSIALMAASGMQSDSETLRQQRVSAAKALLGRYIRHVCEQITQSLGGMGMTREFKLTRYCRRLHAIGMTWGDTNFHMDRFGEVAA